MNEFKANMHMSPKKIIQMSISLARSHLPIIPPNSETIKSMDYLLMNPHYSNFSQRLS